MPTKPGNSLLPIELPSDTKEIGEAIAYIYGKRRGKRGNPTQLCAAVLLGDYLLVPNGAAGWGRSLPRVRDVLVAFRAHEQAKQPFCLRYLDGAGQLKDFLVRYGEVVVHERRLYLDAWVEETPAQPAIASLAHNRSFRLDRIQQVGEIAPGQWFNGLDVLEVTFSLTGGLARGSYERHPDDQALQHGGTADTPTLMVTRRISNIFWFCREVLPYGKDCIVVAPAEVRGYVAHEVAAMWKIYSPVDGEPPH